MLVREAGVREAQLRRYFTENFSEEELKTLCFDLGIDYADLGGVGKTALTLEYGHGHRDNCDLVWWLRANEEPALAATVVHRSVPTPPAGQSHRDSSFRSY